MKKAFMLVSAVVLGLLVLFVYRPPTQQVTAASERYQALKAKQVELADPESSAITAEAVQRRGERYFALKAKQLERADPETYRSPSSVRTARERYEELKAKQLERADR